jgi:Ca2+-binding EF-hand superfamily protein
MNEKITEIIKQCDDNGDGVISAKEFKEMMMNMAK